MIDSAEPEPALKMTIAAERLAVIAAVTPPITALSRAVSRGVQPARGNRDPAFVADPDTLDVTRGAPGHLGYGHGAHRCPGTELSRMLLRIAFPALRQRFPRLRLAVPVDELRWRTPS